MSETTEPEIDLSGNYTLFGVDLFEILRYSVALGILLASILARRMVSQSVMFILKHLDTPQPLQDAAHTILSIPLTFASVFVGFYFGARLLELPPNIEDVFQQISETVVNMAVFWFAFKIVTPLADFWMSTSSVKHNFGEEIKEILTKILKALIVLFGFLAVMEVWGINVKAFLAGMGLVGMAVALAAQDTIKNLFSSLTIIIDRVFHKGDFIITSAVSGIVEHFGIRVTQIRKLDTTLVFVPNSTLSNGVITNVTQGKRREMSWTPQLSGSLSPEIIQKVVDDTTHYLSNHSDVEQENGHPMVHVSDVSDGTVTVMVYFHIKMMPLPAHFAVRETILLKFREIILNHGASFALPTRSVYLREH